MAINIARISQFQGLVLAKCTVSRAFLSGFRSNISLDRLYPSSRLDITTIPSPPENDGKKFTGYIPIDKIQINYSRSSGPGGQNVNCVSTKAEVRFHLSTADWIPEPIRIKLQENLRNQLTRDGYFVMKSDKTRSQHLNLADAINKLRDLIRSTEMGLVTPQVSPENEDRQRRLRERAARERLKEKRLHSMTKQGRQAPTIDQ
nr:EOG090X0JCO [Macrothrix elegans]